SLPTKTVPHAGSIKTGAHGGSICSAQPKPRETHWCRASTSPPRAFPPLPSPKKSSQNVHRQWCVKILRNLQVLALDSQFSVRLRQHRRDQVRHRNSSIRDGDLLARSDALK